MRAITRLLSSPENAWVCLPRPLVEPNGELIAAGDHTNCLVRETLADSGPCGAGRIDVGSEDGGTVCQVCQQGDGEGAFLVDALGNDLSACAGSDQYWFYTFGAECGGGAQIAFADGARPAEGSRVRLACQNVSGG